MLRRLLACFALLSCHKTTAPSPSSTPVVVPPSSPYTPASDEEGLMLRLSEGAPGAGVVDRPRLANATPLSASATDALLARLTPLPAAPTAEFKVRPSSTPPPKTGATVQLAFPPPETTLPPEVASGPVEVVRWAPEGDVPLAAQVSVTFNQAMIPLTTQDEAAKLVPVTLTPQPEGQWRWVGTRTLLFEPTYRMPMATAYTLAVKPDARSVTGGAAKAFTGAFTTPPPRLTTQHPQSDIVTPTPILVLGFDQEVDPQAILRTAQLLQGSARVPMQLAPAGVVAEDPAAGPLTKALRPNTWVALTPVAPLALDTRYTVVAPKGTPSAEGPLTSTADQSWSFETYGAMKPTGHGCGWENKCRPSDGWWVSFANPLAEDDLTAFVTIDPPAPGREVWASGDRLWLQGQAQPRTTYKVTVKAGLKDIFGQTLAEDHTVTFAVGDAEPASPWIGTMGSNPQIADPFAPPRASFWAIGLSKVRVRVAKVSAADWATYAEAPYYNDGAKLPGKIVLDETRALGGDVNTPSVVDVDLAPWLADGGHAVVEVSAPGGLIPRWQRQGQTTWVTATKTGLTAFVDAEDTWIWATDLTTGRPVPDVVITLPGSGQQITTDAHGLAMAPSEQLSDDRQPLLARRGADEAFLTSSGAAWSGSWRRYDTAEDLAWFTFDDRKMYRPSEKVSVKGWVRTVDYRKQGDVLPPGDLPAALTWTCTDAQGVELATGQAQLDGAGGFDLAIQLPGTPNLGTAWVELRLADGRSMTHAFEIQEFRRPEFEVMTQVEDMGPFLVGGNATVAVDAHYYAGGGLPGAEATWTVTTTPTTYQPPGWSEWRFGTWSPPWWGWWGERPSDPSRSFDFTGRTDPSGVHRLRLDFDAVRPSRPTTVQATATVMDVNRQAWTSQATLLVHPADRYVGARPTKTFVDPGEPVDVELVVTDIDGAAVPNVSVSASLVQRVWKATGRGGWHEVDGAVLPCAVTSASKPVLCRFTPEEGGTWELRARVVDAAGRENTTTFPVWASGGRMPEAKMVEQEKVTLIPDKDRYAVGETARILVQAPFGPSDAVVTWRRSGAVHVEHVRIEGTSTTLEVPITEEHLPNLHVQVDLAGAAPRGDAKRPAFAKGELTLDVPPLTRTLTVDVQPTSPAVSPGATTEVIATVRGADGEPVKGAQVALVIADEAVLALSGFHMPDPIGVFYPARDAGVTDLHNRPWIRLADTVPVPSPETSPAGGAMPKSAAMRSMDAMPAPAPMMMMEEADGAAPPSEAGASTPIAVRSDFNPTALWLPAATTGPDGRVKTSFKLPDNLTRYRITAVVVEGKRAGLGESSLTARLPLMLRPSPPRFLNFGDQAELPLVLQNQTDSSLMVDVALRSNNARIDGGVKGGRRITVPPQDRVEVRFPVASDKAGEAVFQAAVSTVGYADAATFTFPVYTPATSEAFATYGTLDGPKGAAALVQPVSVPGDVWPQFGGLEVQTSSTALQSLTDAFIYLVEYPYGCVEQISSRVLSVAALRDVLTAFQAEGLPDREALEAMVNADLEELRRRQLPDGAWGWWNQDPRYASPFTTLHATHALLRAKAAGFDVPPRTLDEALGRIRRIEGMFDKWTTPATRLFLRAYAVQLRELAGDKPVAEAKALYREAGGTSANLDLVAMLLPTLHAGGAPEVAEILTTLKNRVSETAATAQFTTSYAEEEAAVILHSSRRTDALLLDALLQVQPTNDVLPKVVAGLLGAAVKGRWANTQEDAWVLLALDRYFKVAEAVTPDLIARAWLGDGLAGEHTFKGRTTETARIDVPMAWLTEAGGQAPLTLQRDGAGRLYYRLGLRYAPRDLDLDAAERGFSVTRAYEAVDDPADVRRDADGTWRVKAGARVRVSLTMVAPARRYHVALVDPLPAGFEALNPALKVVGDLPPEEPDEAAWARGWWWGPWYEHSNLRDERAEAFARTVYPGVYTWRYVARATTPGRFVVPPAKAEEMYAPETFGRTATARVVVE